MNRPSGDVPSHRALNDILQDLWQGRLTVWSAYLIFRFYDNHSCRHLLYLLSYTMESYFVSADWKFKFCVDSEVSKALSMSTKKLKRYCSRFEWYTGKYLLWLFRRKQNYQKAIQVDLDLISVPHVDRREYMHAIDRGISNISCIV